MMSNEYQFWNASTYYYAGDKVIRNGIEVEIEIEGINQPPPFIQNNGNGNVLIDGLLYAPLPDKTFESELHDLITKYDLDHTTLTPEFIKQQIMRDNIESHNKKLRFTGDYYQAGYNGVLISMYSTDDQRAEYHQGAKDRQREKGDE